MTFYDNGTAIGTGTLAVVGGLDEAGFTTSALPVGTDPITAAYTSGDANFTASPASTPVSQAVGQDGTTMAVASSQNPLVYARTVTFTATVSSNAPGAGSPTGTVTFYNNGTAIGTGTLAVVGGVDRGDVHHRGTAGRHGSDHRGLHQRRRQLYLQSCLDPRQPGGQPGPY